MWPLLASLLACAVYGQLNEEVHPPSSLYYCFNHFWGVWIIAHNLVKPLTSQVSFKPEDRDYREAVSLACSDYTLADMTDATFLLCSKSSPLWTQIIHPINT